MHRKGATTSKIKYAIKHKTSPARLAQLLQPSLAFCFSLQSMTAYRPTVVQQLCKSCGTCFKFYCMFHFTCDRFLIGFGVSPSASDYRIKLNYGAIYIYVNSTTYLLTVLNITVVGPRIETSSSAHS